MATVMNDQKACVADCESEQGTNELVEFKDEVLGYIEELLNPLVCNIQDIEFKYSKKRGREPVVEFLCEMCGNVFNKFSGDGNICNGCMPNLDDQSNSAIVKLGN